MESTSAISDKLGGSYFSRAIHKNTYPHTNFDQLRVPLGTVLNIHKHTHIHTHMHTHTHTHSLSLSLSLSLTHTHIHAHTHTLSLTHTHTDVIDPGCYDGDSSKFSATAVQSAPSHRICPRVGMCVCIHKYTHTHTHMIYITTHAHTHTCLHARGHITQKSCHK